MRTSNLPRMIAAAILTPAIAIAWIACGTEDDRAPVEDEAARTSDDPMIVTITELPPTGAAPSGAPCEGLDDCPEDEQCQGPAGCGVAWTCGPLLRCTRDLVMFCGCDGELFRGSSTCPARPFAHRGPCDEAQGPWPRELRVEPEELEME